MSATRRIACRHVIGADGAIAGAQIVAIGDGRIASIAAAEAEDGATLLAMPALVNAHDHGRALRTSSIGADAKPLETWLQYGALFPAVDPYLAAAVSFANSARGGAGTVMCHYTRAQGLSDLPAEAAEVARAARDVGVRAGFAVAMRDQNPLVYGDSEPVLAALPQALRAEIERRFIRPPLSPRDYIALVDDVAAAAESPNFNVQYGPAGVQWCSRPLLEAVAEASASSGRRIHMHLLETKYQRQWADAAFPDGMLRMLDAIGLLSPRLTLAHCVWARPDELELLAARGVAISINTSSNLHLQSGMAPVAAMRKAGCRLAIGIDSKALDDDDDLLRELRLAYLLHAGTGFDIDISRAQALHAAVCNGRFAVINSPDDGASRTGAAADLLLLDWPAIDDDALRGDIDPLHLLFSRGTARHIREVIVGGHTIVRDGVVTGIDYASARREIVDRTRVGMAANGTLIEALKALDHAIAAHYTGCC